MVTHDHLRRIIASSPNPSLSNTRKYDIEIYDSIQYLSSNKAIESITLDFYWPKWNSPWWHMLLLHEMRETNKIPKVIIQKMIESIQKLPVKTFPIHAHEFPPGIDIQREIACHCALGSIYQILSVWGTKVDLELPWIRAWFLQFQMSDGGFNCDSDAYLQEKECPSSMVGTISPFESILLNTDRPWTQDEIKFLDNGAQFLMKRKLMLGSDTKHNEEEKLDEEKWLKPCFPRFYLYDVLRGLHALLKWSELRMQPLPIDSFSDVVIHLSNIFPDGVIRNLRHSYEGVGTILPAHPDKTIRRHPATFFPLLEKTSMIGAESPFLTRQWSEIKLNLMSLLNKGFIV